MMLVATIVVLAVAVILLTGTLGRWQLRSRVSIEVRTLFSQPAASIGPEQLASRYDELPEPVRRYLHYAISADAPATRIARLKHGGLFRMKPGQKWLPIRGEEYFTIASPGFVWNATVRLAPALWIEARDLLQFGHGNILVKINSAVTIADASGPELDQGASLRWLGEAIWFPYAFVGDQIRWDTIDENCARARLVQNEFSVSAIFKFGNDGELTSICANRYRDLGNGRSVLTPWIAQCSEYCEFGGFRVPTAVDVAWEVDQQRFSYARFRVTTLEYNLSGPEFRRQSGMKQFKSLPSSFQAAPHERH